MEVRAQSRVLVSLLSSGLMASPVSTRNTATCVEAGVHTEGSACRAPQVPLPAPSSRPGPQRFPTRFPSP